LELPDFTNDNGSAKYTDYADYIVNHERKPGIGPLAGFRGDGSDTGRGAVNLDQLDRYNKKGGFFVENIPTEASYYKPWNMAYQDRAVGMGIYDRPESYLFQLYVGPLRKFQSAAGTSARTP